MKQTRIYLADDHLIFLQGLLLLLEKEPHLEIAGHGTNGLHVKQFFNEGGQCDVVVLDLRMPYCNGREVTQFLKSKSPSCKIIVLSVSNDAKEIKEMKALEVDGYLLKDNGGDELVKAIDAVMMGRRYLSRDVMAVLERDMPAQKATGPTFTKKEREVLELIAEGFSTPMIADALGIMPSTVETHRRNLLSKTGMENTLRLVRFAVENGFVKKT